MSNRSNGKSFLIGALFGGITGSITALLFAPKSGEKMRKEIAKKYDEVTEKTQDLVCEVNHQTKELVDKAIEIAEEAKDVAASLMKDLKKK